MAHLGHQSPVGWRFIINSSDVMKSNGSSRESQSSDACWGWQREKQPSHCSVIQNLTFYYFLHTVSMIKWHFCVGYLALMATFVCNFNLHHCGIKKSHKSITQYYNILNFLNNILDLKLLLSVTQLQRLVLYSLIYLQFMYYFMCPYASANWRFQMTNDNISFLCLLLWNCNWKLVW